MEENRLKFIREITGFSQAKLAEITGIPMHKLRDAESGKTKISTDMAAAIEEKLGYNFRWILTGEGQKHPTVPIPTEKLKGAEGSSVYNLAVTDRQYYRDPKKSEIPPTLDQLMLLLRMVIDEYTRMRPESKSISRDIPMIFRHFVDNYHMSHDEVEISEYIEDWF